MVWPKTMTRQPDAIEIGENAAPRLMRRLWPGALAVQCLHAAAVLGLADVLAGGPKSVEELAAATGSHAPSLRRLLRALITIGVFSETDRGEFQHNDVSEALRADYPVPVARRAALLGSDAVWRAAGGLVGAVRNGRTAFDEQFDVSFFDYLAERPEARAMYHAGMPDSGVADDVMAVFDFSPCRRIVEIGGGHGATLTAILRAYQHLVGTLFDQSCVVADATDALRREWGERLLLVDGNFFDGVPAGEDVYLLIHVLHNWNDDAAGALLRNCHAAMRADSRLLVVETRWPQSAEPGRTFTDLLMMVLTGGQERGEGELCDLVGAAGFDARVRHTRQTLIVEAWRR